MKIRTTHLLLLVARLPECEYMNKANLINHAFLHALPLQVYLYGELIGEGRVEVHTQKTVRIGGMYYFKRNCAFQIKS